MKKLITILLFLSLFMIGCNKKEENNDDNGDDNMEDLEEKQEEEQEVKEEKDESILVVLGNWMNDDGTISSTMKRRLDLAIKAYKEFEPKYIVVTGGLANTKAGITEADAMYTYLVNAGIDGNIIIKEDKSVSTYQNANFTMKLIEDIDFKNLIIVSTIEHFVNYDTLKYFNDACLNNAKVCSKKVNIMIYTNNTYI